ncbi:2TM domain-containing protein [Methylobrevis albus]|uniref:2TM domain-containing protein n=1 Tax=Methylobrevis albus TaxID=2793297 RepID=A0A931I043_9HYPH|nr:2TM domain-containing protein [Methylobrevis albus]MBH0237902.1 2TM domain-containing protein [Methylobrevis albus]
MIPMSPAGRRRAVAIHAFAFVVTMIVLLIVNIAVGPPWWVQWPLLGWSIGLLSHWFFSIGPGARSGPA